jgi:mannose-6-phosphate isomerase-like protein (cupin superfamily)
MVRSGDVLVNPASGERAVIRVSPAEDEGQRLVVDLYLRPRGGMTGKHYHPTIHERFSVVSGSITFTLDGVQRVAGAGETVDIPPGRVHDFWNSGEAEALARVEVEPGGRFLEMIQNGFGLAQDGKTDAKGMPNLLQISLFAQEFDDVIRYVQPPPAAQRVMFAVLAPIARWKGYRGSYPEYLAREATERVAVD